MGAQSALAGTGWTGPLALWTGILAGPTAWMLDLGIAYPLAQLSCIHGRSPIVGWLTIGALLMIAGGAWVSWRSLQALPDLPTDGGTPEPRARFMALVGLGTSAFFTLVVIAGDLARWILHGCG